LLFKNSNVSQKKKKKKPKKRGGEVVGGADIRRWPEPFAAGVTKGKKAPSAVRRQRKKKGKMRKTANSLNMKRGQPFQKEKATVKEKPQLRTGANRGGNPLSRAAHHRKKKTPHEKTPRRKWGGKQTRSP